MVPTRGVALGCLGSRFLALKAWIWLSFMALNLTFEALGAWEKADYLALEFYVDNSTPVQRLQWLEDAHDFALQVAYERHSRGLVTIDDEGHVWPRSLALASNSCRLTTSLKS